MTKPFNLGIFQDYLNIYGADLSRWPDEFVQPAQDILKTSKEAQDLYVDALKLDQLFQENSSETAPKGLLDKVLANTDK